MRCVLFILTCVYTNTDFHVYVRVCMQTSASLDMMDATDLQHGLVRWVQNYGDHVLRTLIQRSPKLPHHSPRRHSSSSTSSSNGSVSKTRTKSELAPKPQRYNRATPDLLTPPFMPMRPPTAFQAPLVGNHSPSASFYGMGLPVMSPTAMAPAGLVVSQQNPVQFVRFPPTLVPSSSGVHGPPQHLGTVHTQPQAVGPAAGGMMYHHLPQGYGIPQPQPTSGFESPGTTSLVIQGLPPGTNEPVISKEAMVGASSGLTPPSVEGCVTTAEGSGGVGGSVMVDTDAISKLMQIQHPTSAFHRVQPQPQTAGSSLIEQGGGGAGGGGSEGVTSHLQQPQPHSSSVTGQEHPNPQLQVAEASISNLQHHFIPGMMPPPPLPQPHTVAVSVERPEALLPIPQVVPSVTPLTAIAAPNSQQQHQITQQRKEIICRYFVAGQGHCPYGEKCWFAHLDPSMFHHVEDMRSMPQTTVPTSPLHIQVPAQPHRWNPGLPNVPVPYLSSPPQSPLGGGYVTSNDPSGGIRTPIMHPTPPYAFPGQPPILVWQSPHGRGPRNFPLLPSMRPPLPVPTDPMLRFSLLSEVVVRSNGSDSSSPIPKISQLSTRADHFYISFENKVQDYKILFSGHHSCQESWMLQDTFTFTHRVTCTHSSQQHQYLLLVGTEAGLVHTCSLRRGNQYNLSTVSHICTVEVSDVLQFWCMATHTTECMDNYCFGSLVGIEK